MLNAMFTLTRIALFALLVVVPSFPSIVVAAGVTPAAVPGWTHASTPGGDPTALHGVVLSGAPVVFSTPVIAEVDGNSSDGKEVVVGGSDGILYVYKSSGELLWSKRLPNARCKTRSSDNKLYSSPAVGELYGNGVPYVVVGYGGIGNRSCDGGVIALRGRDGATSWKFSLRAHAQKNRYKEAFYGVFSSPGLSDVDGDGRLEVGFGGFDRNVYLLNADGSERWYYHAADTVWSSPAFIDVNGDGVKEMIIGTDISANPFVRPPTKDGGFLYAFKTAPRSGKKRIEFQDPTAWVWRTHFEQVIYATPVIGELIGSNVGREIVIGSGCYFPANSSKKKGAWLKVLSARTGKVLRSKKITACSPTTPALADIDGDGSLDVVATVNGAVIYGGDGVSRVVAWNPESDRTLWSVIPRIKGQNDALGGNFISPAIADLDGNGSLEVVVPNFNRVHIYAGADGRVLSCETSSCTDAAAVLNTQGTIRSGVAVGDINGDGVLDIVAAGFAAGIPGRGAVYAWTNFASLLGSSPGAFAPYSRPWPRFGGGARGERRYGFP